MLTFNIISPPPPIHSKHNLSILIEIKLCVLLTLTVRKGGISRPQVGVMHLRFLGPLTHRGRQGVSVLHHHQKHTQP